MKTIINYKVKKSILCLIAIATVFTSSCSNNQTPETFVSPENVQEPLQIWNGEIDETWYSPKESEFVLSTAQQLAGLSSLVNRGYSMLDKKISLGSDIYLNDISSFESWNLSEPQNVWKPIGLYHNENPQYFSGKFDGDGHTIYGMYINDVNHSPSIKNVSAGLFGAVKIQSPDVDFSIRNLNLMSSFISVNKEEQYYPYVGSVVGYIIGGGVYGKLNGLLNVVSNCKIFCEKGATYVGGISGFSGANFFNCGFSGELHLPTGSKQFGGISSGGMIASFIVNSYSYFDAGLITNDPNDNGTISYQGIPVCCYYLKTKTFNSSNFAFGNARREETNSDHLAYGNGTFEDGYSQIIIPKQNARWNGSFFVYGDNRVSIDLDGYNNLFDALRSVSSQYCRFPYIDKIRELSRWQINHEMNNGYPII